MSRQRFDAARASSISPTSVSSRGIGVGVVNPHPPARRSRAFQPTFFKQIRTSALGACQFPPVLTERQG